MIKISYASYLGLSPAISLFHDLLSFPIFHCSVWSVISTHNLTPELCVATKNREKFIKTPYFGGLRSFKIIDIDIPKKLVASACYNKQHVCAYLRPFLR